jgi:hypothetical protein
MSIPEELASREERLAKLHPSMRRSPADALRTLIEMPGHSPLLPCVHKALSVGLSNAHFKSLKARGSSRRNFLVHVNAGGTPVPGGKILPRLIVEGAPARRPLELGAGSQKAQWGFDVSFSSDAGWPVVARARQCDRVRRSLLAATTIQPKSVSSSVGAELF